MPFSEVGLPLYGAGITEDKKDFVSSELAPTPTTVTPPLSTVPFIVETETDENGGIFLKDPLLVLSLKFIISVKIDSRFLMMEFF